jgi:hypothetical protein
MSKTIRTKVFKFEELNDKAKEVAMNHFANINVDDRWYENIYSDAENVGIKINGFDIDRGRFCSIVLSNTASDTVDLIIKEHGESCDTYKTAMKHRLAYNALVEKYSDGTDKTTVTPENEYDFDNEVDTIDDEFKEEIAGDYLTILSNEYDYLTGEESVKETIIINEYYFTRDGRFFPHTDEKEG